MKVIITIIFLFLVPCNTVTYTQKSTDIQNTMSKRQREMEFRSALNDLTNEDIKKATDFKAWINSWIEYVDTGLQPHPKHKPPF